MWIGWNAVTAATDSSLASLLVADSPSHNTSTQTTVFIASTHHLPPARDDSPQSFYKHTTHISYHSGETLRSVRHPRFQPPPARHDRATQSSRLPTNRRQHAASRDHLPRSKQSTASTLSRPRGPSSIHVPWQSTRADNPRLPSNLREHKVFVFQAIDDSTKSSSSKQSTTAQSLRLPSNRRAFLHQHTERRAATYERKTTGREHSWPRTHQPHPQAQPVHARALTLHARTRHTLTTQTQTTTNCMPVSRTNSLSLLNGNKKKKMKRNRIKNHTLTIQTQTAQNEKMYECHVCAPEKMPLCLRVQCPSLKNKKKKKKKKEMFRSSLLSVLHPK